MYLKGEKSPAKAGNVQALLLKSLSAAASEFRPAVFSLMLH